MVDESQDRMIDDLLNMSDEKLIRWTLSGSNPEAYIGQYGRLVFEMRCATKNLKATKHMMVATWAIALITLATQIALIMVTVKSH